MAWSPSARKRRVCLDSDPGDYATFNSNHTPDGTIAGRLVDSFKKFYWRSLYRLCRHGGGPWPQRIPRPPLLNGEHRHGSRGRLGVLEKKAQHLTTGIRSTRIGVGPS